MPPEHYLLNVNSKSNVYSYEVVVCSFKLENILTGKKYSQKEWLLTRRVKCFLKKQQQ